MRQILRFSFLLLSFCFLKSAPDAYAQAANATWPLTANATPSATATLTSSPYATGSAILGVNYNASGAGGTGWNVWPATTQNANAYHEYAVAPAGARDFLVNSVSFLHSATGEVTAAVYYSLDNFATRTQISSNFTANTTEASFSAATSILVPQGATLRIRVYGWFSALLQTRTFRNRNVVISGTTCNALSVTTSPANQNLCQGQTLTLTASIANAVSYEWFRNGSPIVGASTATYTKANVAPADTGRYTVSGVSACGSRLTAAPAQVSVSPAPTLNPTAASTTICQGTSTTLNAGATMPSGVVPVITNAVPIAIPENNTTGINSVIAVPLTCAMATQVASVGVNITHPYNDDLELELFAPNGDSMILSARKGGSGDNYTCTFVTGGAALPTTNSTISGNVAPQEAFSTLSGNATGQWRLNVRDVVNQDTGTLNGWSISFNNTTCGQITYSWTPAGTLSNAAVANPTATPTANTVYSVTATAGGCSRTATVTVNVTPASVGGTTSGAMTVCAGTNNGTITLSGNTGDVLRWESSLDNFATAPVTIANTTNSLGWSNLSATTYYRAVVGNGGCASAYSTVTAITVSPGPSGGTTSGGTTVCIGPNGGTINLTGNIGPVVRWESSTDDFASAPTVIANTTNSLNWTDLTQTTAFRAVINNGTCDAYSTVTTINVIPEPVGGTLNGGMVVCGAVNSGVLTCVDFTGTIVQWESSTDNFATAPTVIVNTTASYQYNNISVPTSYRVLITNGACSTYSSVAQLTVGGTTTWDGFSWSNGAPDAATGAIFAADYSEAADITACSISVINNSAVSIPSGFTVNVGPLNVESGSSFTLQNNANLLQPSDVVNTDPITVRRNSSALMRQDYTIWSSPVAGQGLLAFSPLTVISPTVRFYFYNTQTNLYSSIANINSAQFMATSGYLIRMPNNHPTTPTIWTGSFNGVPHNGPYQHTMTNLGPGQSFNLVGNPYPSPISMVQFVDDNNLTITGTLYFWRKTNNELSPSYCSWTEETFVSNGEAQVFDPENIIRTGQGFFVEALPGETQLVFNNAQRTDDHADQFFRQAAEKHRIWLNLTNPAGKFSQTAIVYVEGADSNGLDKYDGRYINDGPVRLTQNRIDRICYPGTRAFCADRCGSAEYGGRCGRFLCYRHRSCRWAVLKRSTGLFARQSAGHYT